ncbi:MAG TPA: hypothetical protein VJ346_03480 [Bacteroidales bacterium]|nr:hypothetical protein [Bacteroidales bacterium]
MKKSVFILAMLLMAATAFTQTSRRTANSQKPAREEQAKSTAAKKQRTSGKRSSAGSTTDRSPQAQGTIRRTHVNATSNQSRNTASASQHNRSAQATHHHAQSQGSANVHTGTKYVTYYHSPRLYHGTRVVKYHYNSAPRSRHYRARHFPYRVPGHIEIYWTPAMRTEYIRIYPMVSAWRYPIGYRIHTISAYDAILYHGEVINVYGKVYEVFYSRQTDEYVLYFGAYYPYHDMSVVVPGWVARRMSRWPEEFFERQHVIVTGLITTFEDRPEIVVRNTGQLRIY